MHNLATAAPGVETLAAIAGEAAPELVACVESGNAFTQTPAAALLCELAMGGPHACAALAQAGAPPTMLRVLQRSSDDGMLHFAAGTLNNLQVGGEPADAAAAAAAAMEALPQLLLLVRQGSGRSQTAAARALAALSVRPEYRAMVLPATVAALPQGGIPGVIEVSPRGFRAAAAQPAPGQAMPQPTSPSHAAPATPAQQPGAQEACAACRATSGTLRRCGGCRVVRYCSEACSRAHWKQRKAACRRLQAQQAAAGGAREAAAR